MVLLAITTLGFPAAMAADSWVDDVIEPWPEVPSAVATRGNRLRTRIVTGFDAQAS